MADDSSGVQESQKKLPALESYMAMSVGGGMGFRDAGRDPRRWFMNARRLKRAADLLTPPDESDLVRKMTKGDKGAADALTENMQRYGFLEAIALMLVGMSFESLLKGLLIAADPSLVGPQRIDKTMGTHDLAELADLLAQKSGPVLSPTEVGLLHPVLTDLVLWAGRYPIPVAQNNMINQFTHSSERQKGLNALWEKLAIALQEKQP